MLGCAGGVATSGNSDGCAPGAVGAVVGELSARYAKDVLHWDDEKALAFAGVMSAASGVIVAQDGNDAGAVNLANTMGDNAARYNYLADHQEAKKAKELANCKTPECKDAIEKKWDKISREQNLAYGLGIVQGVGIGAFEAGAGLAHAVMNPVETYNQAKALLSNPNLSQDVKNLLQNELNQFEAEYQSGTTLGAKNAGIIAGRLSVNLALVADAAVSGVQLAVVGSKVVATGGKAAIGKFGGKGAAAGAKAEAGAAGKLGSGADNVATYPKLRDSLASEEQLSQLKQGKGVVLAGQGSKVSVRDAPRLAAQYGGEPSDWVKVSSGSFKSQNGKLFEIHAYRNVKTGQVVEPKTKTSYK